MHFIHVVDHTIGALRTMILLTRTTDRRSHGAALPCARRPADAHKCRPHIASGIAADNTARSTYYYTVGKQVGERSLQAVGLQMSDTAVFPPGIDDIRSVLASLDHAYKLHCRAFGLARFGLQLAPAAPRTAGKHQRP